MDKQTRRPLPPWGSVYKRRQHRVVRQNIEQIETGQTGQEPFCQGKTGRQKSAYL